MSAKIIKEIIIQVVSIFAAINFSVWLAINSSLYMLGFFNSTKFDFIFTSFQTFQTSVFIFSIIMVPIILIYWNMGGYKKSHKDTLLYFAIIGVVVGVWCYLYLLYSSGISSIVIAWNDEGFNLIQNEFLRYLIVYPLVGLIGGYTAWGLSGIIGRFTIPSTRQEIDQSKRNILSVSSQVASYISLAIFVSPFAYAISRLGRYKDVDIEHVQPGQLLSLIIDKRPVWIIRRTEKQISELTSLDAYLFDRDSDNSDDPANINSTYRSIRKEWFVVYPICTHLPCSVNYRKDEIPIFNSNLPKISYLICPCHGATFDMAGRVFKGGFALRNLDIPHYSFVEKNKIRIHYRGLWKKLHKNRFWNQRN